MSKSINVEDVTFSLWSHKISDKTKTFHDEFLSSNVVKILRDLLKIKILLRH
jgi:hypothetical protein